MDSYTAPVEQSSLQSLNIAALSYEKGDSRKDVLVLEATFSASDKVNVGIDSSGKALSISADQIIEKLNEILKARLPNGIQSLKPEEVTPEATAERIVNGSTAFYDVYAKQHPELQGEDLLKSFMDTIRGGIEEGYSDAFDTLKELGAFEFKGVQDSVEQTKALIESKLVGFEKMMREKMGLSDSSDTAQAVSADTKANLLEQTGGSLVNVVA